MTETCSDIALGVSTQILWLVIFIESLVTESLMQSAMKPQGVFFMFGFFSACAVVFEYFFVAETKGLSEREKKALYCPGAPYGRRVEPQEEIPRPPSPTMSEFSEASYAAPSNFRALDARWSYSRGSPRGMTPRVGYHNKHACRMTV